MDGDPSNHFLERVGQLRRQWPPSLLIFLLISNVCQSLVPACWSELFGGVPAAGPGWQPWKRAGERRFMCYMAGYDRKEQDLFAPDSEIPEESPLAQHAA